MPAQKQDLLTLSLLDAIDESRHVSQRHLAQRMGVALGMANAYLKRCVRKGWIKISTAPANRYMYYLTPTGFAEKARLTTEFLSTSLALFRQSRQAYSEVFADCESSGHSRVVLAGVSDLTEIAYTRSMLSEVNIVAVYQPQSTDRQFFDLPIIADADLARLDFDAIVLTSLEQTQELADRLESQLDSSVKLLVPPLLLSMRRPLKQESSHAKASTHNS